MIQHITDRRTLKRLRGVFRKWIKAGTMTHRETYSRTSRAPAEVSLPPVPIELSAPTLSAREIEAIHARRYADKVVLSDRTQRALDRARGRRNRRAVLEAARAQAEALNR